MPNPSGLRAQKKQRRRARIEAAAMDLFESAGFEETTIEEIAAASDISPRTFFYYFPTKEDVVLADYSGRLQRITEELRGQPSGAAPWAALRACFLVVAADYETERRQLVRRFSIMAANPSIGARSLHLQAGWEDTVSDVLSERMGNDGDHLRIRLLAAAALTCVRSSIQHWTLTGYDQPLPELVKACFDDLAAGLDARDE